MGGRRVFLDRAPGETRAAVYLDGAPERLLVERAGEPEIGRIGAEAAARIRKIDPTLAAAFVDLGSGVEALMAPGPEGPPPEGALVRVVVVAPARPGKSLRVRHLGPAEGAPGLRTPAPSLEARLAFFAPAALLEEGPEARAAVDEAEEAALETEHGLPGGGRIFVETTRALTSIDVDTGRAAGPARRVAARVNLEAVAAGARVLRLKGLGGVAVFDLVGRGHDGERIAEAARAAFAPDGPEVVIGRISRLGLFEVAVPRRSAAAADFFLGDDGQQTDITAALRLLREMDRRAGPGVFVTGRASRRTIDVARSLEAFLRDRIGARFAFEEAQAAGPGVFEVIAT